jgi:4-hydroxybenzoate polyprenyltransferase
MLQPGIMNILIRYMAGVTSRPSRIWRYLLVMFPPHLMLLSGVAKFYAAYFCLQALASEESVHISLRSMGGAISIVLFSLLLRVYDELKDAKADIRLGRAGDPRYRDRPIVTGTVTIEDLGVLRWVVTALLVAINLPMGGWSLIGFAVLFLVTWLSFKLFFWPATSEHLLLAFITHNPITLFFVSYIVAVYAGDFGIHSVDAWALILLIAFWAPLGAWETARKIRAPEDETDYQTYSRVFGWKLAPFVPIAFIALGTTSMILLSGRLGLNWILPAVVVAASCVPGFRCIAFRISPSKKTAVLQPFVELYAVAMDLGLLVAILVSRGLDPILFVGP